MGGGGDTKVGSSRPWLPKGSTTTLSESLISSLQKGQSDRPDSSQLWRHW